VAPSLRLAGLMPAVGGIVALVGVIGLAAGIGETTTRVNADGGASVASDDEAQPESPEVFLTALAKAEREGDAEFRFERLHPAVIERYGEDVCRGRVDEPGDPSARFEGARLDHIGPWDYTSDGATTTIDAAAFVIGERSADNQPAEQVTVHIAAIDGEYRWFTDCTPA